MKSKTKISPHPYNRNNASISRLIAATAFGAMVASHLAVASDGPGFEGDGYLSDIPVVLTVTRLPQSRAELPTAVTVIDREMIEASGAMVSSKRSYLTLQMDF